MKKRIALLTAVALMATFALSACGMSKPPASVTGTPPPADPAQLETIIFTEPVRGYYWAPAYLAETLGYFEEVGLKAEFQTITGADSSAPVLAGEAQFGLRGVEMAMMANEAGQGCKILLSTTSRYPYQLIGATQEYSTLESLRGKVVAGGQGSASSPFAFSKACLMQAGLTPDTDVSVISMASAGYAAAIQSGEIQAAVATNPWASKTLLDQGGVVIADGTDEAFMKELLGSADYELFMVFASDDYIKSNPETVQKTVTAIAKAIDWMSKASEEEIAQNLEPLFEGQHDQLLYSAQTDRAGKIQNATGFHTPSGYAAALKLTKLSGAIQTDVPEEKIYDESFLTNAWKELK